MSLRETEVCEIQAKNTFLLRQKAWDVSLAVAEKTHHC